MRHRLYWGISGLVTILIALGSNCFAADSVTWGSLDGGLRLGLATDPANSNLRVILHNNSPTGLSVLVAMKSGNGRTYGFAFTATALDGKQYTIWDMQPGSMRAVAGVLLPEITSLAPGTTREFSFPLRDLVYMAQGGRFIPLDSLLQRGYAFTASLEVRQKNLDGAVMGGIPRPVVGRLWTGRVTCSLRPLNSGH